MCEWINGELIISFPKVDLAANNLIDDIRHNLIDHVSYIESLTEKLGKLGLQADPSLEFEFYRVSVPPGQEIWKATYLQFFYKHKLLDVLLHPPFPPGMQNALSRSDYQFNVAPNHILGLAIGNSFGRSSAVRATNFRFSPLHDQYKRELRVPPSIPLANAGQLRILIVDSGIADDVPFIIEKENFVDPKNEFGATSPNDTSNVTDYTGHGTAVALIIHDLMPNAHIVVYRVFGASKYASEWDTLAALAAAHNAHVINISIVFGFGKRDCKTCGRQSESSRSHVFETIIDQFKNRLVQPILVAAAGNHQENKLSYPARFGHVLAIESVTSQKELSTFSNYGSRDAANDIHENRFVLPGGEKHGTRIESIGQFGNGGKPLYGTSFAAAYATGIVANVRAQLGIQIPSDVILNTLKYRALKYNDQLKYGNGLMRL